MFDVLEFWLNIFYLSLTVNGVRKKVRADIFEAFLKYV